jgi:hypothetical protein
MLTQGGSAAVAQRRRWEAGRSAVRHHFWESLIRSGLLGPYHKVMYAMDLLFPPLVLLTVAWLTAASLHLGALLDARWGLLSAWLLPLHLTMLAILVVYVVSPVFLMGLPCRYLTSLLAVPRYAVWKGWAALHGRPREWVRTARETAESPQPFSVAPQKQRMS